MSTQHTPGEWRAYNADGARIFKQWRIHNGKVVIATIGADPTISTEEEHGNALVMAAAKDMLAALEAALTALHPGTIGLIGTHHGEERMTQASDAVLAARAAIAKAKGQA